MKFTLSWLKDHLETDEPLSRLVERLSMLGLEVEGVVDPGAALAPFRLAFVEKAEQHPNADRLRVCTVRTAEGTTQVVCGAPNAKTGMWGVFAPPGSHVPGTGVDLKVGQIRGVESRGMLVSERELGLSDDHEGIIELDPAAFGGSLEIGTPYTALLGLDDPVVEGSVTPNRGDCLGVRGIARDLAAAGLGRLKPLNAPAVPGTYDSPINWRRDLPADRDAACPYVAGRHFRGVANGPSPTWMQQRLRAVGLRPISALVDITNYVTHDLGRPLHVFDAAKLQGDPTMRFARAGESLLALDGRTYALDETMLVIADEAGPQAIGGIMGGEPTGCGDDTTEVFLEVALFDPILVAETGRTLGIHSDARHRFERGVDPESADWGVEVAARLIAELCGGEASRTVSAGTLPQVARTVGYRPARLHSLGGVELPADRQAAYLEDLGIAVARDGERWGCTIPSWRPDIEGEACLVEEVLRLYGYEHLPATPLERDESLPRAVLTAPQRRASAVRAALANAGLEETVTFSFVDEPAARLFGWSDERLRVDNPISSELVIMRPGVLPTLVRAAAANADRGWGDVGLFEVGPAYRDTTPTGQDLVAGVLRAGAAVPRHWLGGARPVDAFDAKADALRVLDVCGLPTENLQVTTDAPAWYHPGQSGALRLGQTVFAWFGALHPRVLATLGLKGPAVACEVFLDRVPEPRGKAGKLRPPADLPAFQPVARDYAFLLAEDVPAEKLVRAIRGADRQLIARVDLFDQYRGQGVPEGQKSLAVAVTLQPRERTLTEQDLEAVSAKIVAQAKKLAGATLRG